MTRFTSNFFVFLGVFVFISSTLPAAVPAGYYYFAKNKKKDELKTALHMYCAPMKVLDYGSGPGFTWEGFYYTDRNADNSVKDMYSGMVRTFSGFSSVSGMHIEHSFPKSWWGSHPNDAYKDLFHLYPADAAANIAKSNLPPGEVSGATSFDNTVIKVGKNGFGTFYSDNCFEPADEFKGDFARSYFYISTIYQNYNSLWQSPMMNNNTYPVWKPWAVELLMKWHRQDPVSEKEQARVEAVYNIQGNRNPFIDYPELVYHIWGADTTQIFPFPNETEAFLLSPRRGATLDFGVILQNDSRSQTLHIQGVNINSELQFSLTRNHPAFALSFSSITSSQAFGGADLGISFTPQSPGMARDTLLVHGGGLAEMLRIPISALASSDFITLEPREVTPVGATLRWIADPQATGYRVSVYQGDLQAGDLFISSYVEGSSWNKALEIFNGTGRTIDLSNYSLQKQSDGTGNFGSTVKLSGTLENNNSYAIVHRKSTNLDLQSKAQLFDTLVLNMNGNDAIALVRNGVTIDMVGHANAGADVVWGLDLTLRRKPGITHPVSAYNPAEWTTWPVDTWDMLGKHSMETASESRYILQDLPVGNITSYAATSLMPENTYTYRIEAIKANENIAAINTMQLRTVPLDVPVPMLPTDISPVSFTAGWEETLFATGYLLNVFELAGKADTTVIETFDQIGSNGKPLPEGWSGTASGNYTTTASAGAAPPSIQLKNAGEWLQTCTYPGPVSRFTFMYKFPSASAGSSFVIEGFGTNGWETIANITYNGSTAKFYPSYTFTRDQGMTAFRFTYNKVGGGNLSIDDVQATYGSQEQVFIHKDLAVEGTQANIQGLVPGNTYYYNVRATLGNSVSQVSETTAVHTSISNKLDERNIPAIRLHSRRNGIYVSGLQGSETIQVYSLTGICLFQDKARASEMEIPLRQIGIFIIRIQSSANIFTSKILR